MLGVRIRFLMFSGWVQYIVVIYIKTGIVFMYILIFYIYL